MAPISTEGRIFADRYCRALRLREEQDAMAVAGVSEWKDISATLIPQLERVGPRQRVGILAKVQAALTQTRALPLAWRHTGRSAHLEWLTITAGPSPFVAVEDTGVLISSYLFAGRREGGASAIGGDAVAFVSRHALGRLHERDPEADPDVVCVKAAVLSQLVNVNTSIALHLGGTGILVGSVKSTVNCIGQKTLLDIRTVLPADTDRQDVVDQGKAAAAAVDAWLAGKVAVEIPLLPVRDDFTSRTAVRRQAAAE